MNRARWTLVMFAVLGVAAAGPAIPDLFHWVVIRITTEQVLSHHMNGELKERFRVKRSETDDFGDRIRHGPFKEWHDNGKLMLVGRYRDGKLHGQVLTLDNSGERSELETYDGGRRVGRQAYFYPDGKPRKLEYHRLVGSTTEQYFQRTWRPDGTFDREDGRRPDKVRWWDEDVRNRVESLGDQVQEWARDWHANGQVATERHWDRKEGLLLWKEWHSSGQLKLHDNGKIRQTWKLDGQLDSSTSTEQEN